MDQLSRSYDYILLTGGQGDSQNVIGEADEAADKQAKKDHE